MPTPQSSRGVPARGAAAPTAAARSVDDEDPAEVRRRLDAERWRLLRRIDRSVEPVLTVLSAVWIALVVADLVNRGLPRSLEILVWAIWIVFILDFAVGILIAPDRLRYLRTQWLTAVALLLPALRILRLASALRVLRGVRVVRSVGLLRLATTVNRGLGALGRTARRRGLGYVVAATALVIVLGAAGMFYFESPAGLAEQGAGGEGAGLDDYGEALWWTAYTMTTGPIEQPLTAEGRLLGWLLSVYGLVIFGYLTAILASHFVGRDRAEGPTR